MLTPFHQCISSDVHILVMAWINSPNNNNLNELINQIKLSEYLFYYVAQLPHFCLEIQLLIQYLKTNIRKSSNCSTGIDNGHEQNNRVSFSNKKQET